MKRILSSILFFLLFTLLAVILVFIFEKNYKQKINPDQNKLGIEVYQKNKYKPVTINWIGGCESDPYRVKFIKEAANNYEFKNNKIHINLKFIEPKENKTPWQFMSEYIVNMIHTSSYSTDIICIDQIIYFEVGNLLGDMNWGKKYLVNFENLPDFKNSHKENFLSGFEEVANNYGGIIPGPLIEGNCIVLWYNSEITDKIGVNIKESGLLFTELLDIIKQIQQYNTKNKTSFAPLYEAKDRLLSEQLFQYLFLSEIGNLNQIRDASPETKLQSLRSTLNAFEELGKLKPLINSHLKNSLLDTRNLILDDKAVFYVGGLEEYNYWLHSDNTKAKKMKKAELPVFKPTDFYLGYYGPAWAVFKSSQNINTSVNLLMSLTTMESAKKWTKNTNLLTGLKQQDNKLIVTGNHVENFNELLEKKYNYNLVFYPLASYIINRQDNIFYQALTNQIRLILTGEKSAEQTYNDIVQAMNNL